MVNKAPSKGCHSCRARHVKCDEARPECKKCTSRGQICPGYRNAGNIVFKQQYPKAALEHARSHRFRGQRENSDCSSSSSSDYMCSHPALNDAYSTWPGNTKSKIHFPSRLAGHVTEFVFIQELYGLFPPSLTLDAEAFCLNFYFEVYLNDASLPLVRRHADELRKLYPKTHHRSPFALAVLMLAVQVTSEQLENRHRTTLECNVSRKAVKALRAAIANPSDINTNETLAAILLFIHGEHQSSRKTGGRISDAHLSGATALLKHLSMDPEKYAAVSRDMMSMTRAVAAHSVIMLNRDPREDRILWQMGDDLLSSDTTTRLNASMAAVLDLEAQVLDFVETMDSTTAGSREKHDTLDALFDMNALHIQQCLEEWPTHWELSKSIAKSYPFGPKTAAITINTALNGLYILNQWRCVRLMYLRVLHALLSLDNAPRNPQLLSMAEISLETGELLAAMCYDVQLFLDSENTTVQAAKRASSTMRTQMSDILLASDASPLNGLRPDGKWYAFNLIKWALAIIDDGMLQRSLEAMGRSANLASNSKCISWMRGWKHTLQQRYWTGVLGVIIDLPALHASYAAENWRVEPINGQA